MRKSSSKRNNKIKVQNDISHETNHKLSNYDIRCLKSMKELHDVLKATFDAISSNPDSSNKNGISTQASKMAKEWLSNFERLINSNPNFTDKISSKIIQLYENNQTHVLNIINNQTFLKNRDFVLDVTPAGSANKFKAEIGKIYEKAVILHTGASTRIHKNETTELWAKSNEKIMSSTNYLIKYEIEYRLIDLFLNTLDVEGKFSENHDNSQINEDDKSKKKIITLCMNYNNDLEELNNIRESLKTLSRLDKESIKKDTLPKSGILGMISENFLPSGTSLNTKDMNSEQMKGLLGNIVRPEFADKVMGVFGEADEAGDNDVTIDKFFDALAPSIIGETGNEFIPDGINILESNKEKLEKMKEHTKEIANIVTDIVQNPNNKEEEKDESSYSEESS